MMKKQKSNPIAAACGALTLLALHLAVRRVMKKYGQRVK